ncbi:multiple epidermal growth factor-like domains protein 6 [Plakobranchus ocellatus]|uniref:Multiple epidermal growth factor-like domains protein 6 n=1 Tax=Plakobranchus ocellatus TaxID=259542 RepID=A0AAV4AN12_9GAST|nr:multiple epidermal growth factor-like domains protein 6 [Plakobranchus ocellatus]
MKTLMLLSMIRELVNKKTPKGLGQTAFVSWSTSDIYCKTRQRAPKSASSKFERDSTCLVPALIDDPRCGRCIMTKSQSPKFTGGLGAAWLGRVN